ncbi:hypothetical protein TEHD23766T_1191 [Tetragenococcus halophilus subsp. flandriensis]|nr:hypothetical protein [Tetragenococcus halophilus]GBD63764.1 hypothetical protein TEHD23766T_1191 [Tetragenococcus halophilus subsp. flandriensis]
MPNLTTDSKIIKDMDNVNKTLSAANDAKEKRNTLQDDANKQTIENTKLLQEIADNTSYLKDLVKISRETQLNTEELTYISRAIFDVAKANSKEEADSLYKKALEKLTSSGEDIGNISNWVTLLSGIYNIVTTID